MSSFISDFRSLLQKHGIDSPAFCHGSKVFDASKPKCLYSGPLFDDEEIVAAVSALVEGKWSVVGEHVRKFERLFSSYVGQRETAMVNSGSSADLLMLAAAKEECGWDDGDGIIVSPVGFPTTISAITLNNLTPIFVDIEWTTLNADNDLILNAAKISRRAKAILVSPVLGNPPDMDVLADMADRHGLKILLDGCDSLGSTWRERHLSAYALASSCSFFPSHHISTLQGGSVSSNNRNLISLVRKMSAWGKECDCHGAANMLTNGVCGKRFSCWLPSRPDLVVDHRYVYGTDRAYNLQPLDIQGAIGCAQMAKIEMIHEARKMIHGRLKTIADGVGLVTAKKLDMANPSWFGFSIICPSAPFKQRLVFHLEKFGVQTRNYFAGNILSQPGYSYLGRASDYPNAQQVLDRVLFIGCNPGWSEAHLDHIEKTLKGFVYDEN